MKIRNKTVFVYDIEVFPNVFHCAVKDTETNQYYFFEISERKNQLKELVDFFWRIKDQDQKGLWARNYTTDTQFDTDRIFCGYNNIHYDNPIINYIIDYHLKMLQLPYTQVCLSIYNLSNTIIQSNDAPFSKWHKWKYKIYFETLDLLTMLYSQKLRVGLKEMQVTMQFRNVQEYEGDFQSNLPVSEIDKMKLYNINDVDSTAELLCRCQKDIDLRLAIEDEYGVKVLNKDGVNIGMKIITQKYLEKTGQTWKQIKDLRSPCDLIDLSKVILPIVKFNTPILKEVLKEMKQQIVSPGRKGYEKHFILDGLEYCIGVGGLHSVNKPEEVIPSTDQILSDIDVASLYPSMIIEHKFYPQHLGKEFLEVYSQIKSERIEAKHNGNKVKNETLKLALNGLSGNLQNEHNFCYSPFTVMQIRINGQLLLLMLAEQLIQLGCRIVQANTDGLFVLRPKNKEIEFQRICKDWETLTKLTLEEDRFEAMYQFAINDYLAIKEGYSKTKDPNLLKKKGMFIDHVKLGKGMDPIIIPQAINKCLADGIDVAETIYSCQNIHSFITYQKVSKDFSVEYNGELIQRINRYYVSTDGAWLYKCKIQSEDQYVSQSRILLGTTELLVDNGEIQAGGQYWYHPDVKILEENCSKRLVKKGTRTNYINMLTSSGVTLINTITSTQLPANINYRYYIREANKIISVFKQKQLTLF